MGFAAEPAQEGTFECPGYRERTVDSPLPPPPPSCRAREILDRVADKWSLYAIAYLGTGTMRFTELKRRLDGVSQRMLTVTLRGLEREGIVTLKFYPVMPLMIDSSPTEIGYELLGAVMPLITWADDNMDAIDRAREAYDAKAAEDSEAV